MTVCRVVSVEELRLRDACYHQERRTNTLGRYVVLSFTYRFGTFGGRRGGRGQMGGGRPMGGGGFRPPMGGGFGGGFGR